MEWHKLHPGTTPPLTEQEKEYFRKQGLPIPGEGITTKPISSIKMKNELKASVKQYNKEQQEKGYVDRFSKDAKNLFKMPQIAQKEFEHYNQRDAQSTHLRRQFSELKINYNYEPLSSDIANEVIGFAPESSYVESGWNGAVEFFKWDSQGAVCSFSEINIQLTGSSAFIPKEIVKHSINNKITMIATEGNEESGYIYMVEWWDKTFRRNLDCAIKNYSHEIKNEVIGLAKIIDKNR